MFVIFDWMVSDMVLLIDLGFDGIGACGFRVPGCGRRFGCVLFWCLVCVFWE